MAKYARLFSGVWCHGWSERPTQFARCFHHTRTARYKLILNASRAKAPSRQALSGPVMGRGSLGPQLDTRAAKFFQVT